MSISYDIYNTEEKFSDMSQWESDHFHPIGSPEYVIDSINRLFYLRKLSWQYHESFASNTPYISSYSALADGNCDQEKEYLDLYLTVHKDGYVCEISARKGSPKLVQLLMERFSLKYVFEMQSCSLVDPYLYHGNWEPKYENC